MGARTISLEEARSRWLENPEARRIYEESEPAYQLARLRIMRGLTQQELAELVGTKQPSIARLESGKRSPSLPFLQRVAEALGTTLSVKIEVEAAPEPDTGIGNAFTCVRVRSVPKVKSEVEPTEAVNVMTDAILAAA